uniref:DNA methylase, putative n=1 Tax=uncultured Armatimonadetes bacterium TaxID=157466 RepID=A0A6J4IX88_9BACT|nr:DNA methylase, putative [uncultured Armatimonadetes bacterium]
MTPAEAFLWQKLRGSRLGWFHFRRQQIIDGFIADFYCQAAGLVVELDGAVHDERKGYDAERDAIIAAHGLRILRFPNSRIESEVGTVLAEILAAAREATADP